MTQKDENEDKEDVTPGEGEALELAGENPLAEEESVEEDDIGGD